METFQTVDELVVTVGAGCARVIDTFHCVGGKLWYMCLWKKVRRTHNFEQQNLYQYTKLQFSNTKPSQNT